MLSIKILMWNKIYMRLPARHCTGHQAVHRSHTDPAGGGSEEIS